MKIEVVKYDDGFDCSKVSVTLKGETYTDNFFLCEDFETNKQVQKEVAEKILQKNNIFNHTFLEQQAQENGASFLRLDDGTWLYKQEDWQCVFQPIPYTIYTRQVL